MEQIIHNECGRPIEVCVCDSATMGQVACHKCDGKGVYISKNERLMACKKCGGRGILYEEIQPIKGE